VSVDLRTTYLGLELRSPIVASASPLTGDIDGARRVEEAGAGAIVLPSLFEEEIVSEEIQLHHSLEAGAEQFAEALGYFPAIESLAGAGDRYLTALERIKARAAVPVIASLNAASAGGWVRYARLIQDAGADALELNLYHLSADRTRGAADMEATDLELIGAVRAAVGIPLAVKLSPFYSALAEFAGRVIGQGADGLVLFNRFYQPDLDLDTLDVVPRIDLSQPWELRLPMRWIAILRPQLGASVSIAASSGVHSGSDVIKALMVGADVAMTTSSLLRRGAGHLRTMERDMCAWMEEHEYESVAQLRGSATQSSVDDPSAFERANYMRTIHSWAAPVASPSAAGLSAVARHGPPRGR
jgi:dihydroorotate dehydrogenase (fumarate)